MSDFRERRLNRSQISRRPDQGNPNNERFTNRHQFSRREADQPKFPCNEIVVAGPCLTYTPDEMLPDTDFEYPYPGGCVGPDRVGINLKNLSTNVVTIIPAEWESDSPLTLSTDDFEFTCKESTETFYIEVVFNSLDRSTDASSEVIATVYKSSDDSVIQTFDNVLASWDLLLGGNLQIGPDATSCTCGTLPFNLCLSIPTR